MCKSDADEYCKNAFKNAKKTICQEMLKERMIAY